MNQINLLEGDKFSLLEEIGEGGFGKVYKAEHASFDEPIAFKEMKGGTNQLMQDKER